MQEIVSAFQRSLKHDNSAEIEEITLEEIQDADTMLGPRDLNAPYRMAMQNRISALSDVAQSASGSSTPTNVDKFFTSIQNHKTLSIILIVGIVFVTITAVTESGMFWLDLVRPNSPSDRTPLESSGRPAAAAVLPIEIYNNIESVSPFQQEAIAKSYAGLEVSWKIYFDDVSVKSGLVFFRYAPKSRQVIIYCNVVFDSYPFLKIAQIGDVVGVHGFINKVDGGAIALDNCIFDI